MPAPEDLLETARVGLVDDVEHLLRGRVAPPEVKVRCTPSCAPTARALVRAHHPKGWSPTAPVAPAVHRDEALRPGTSPARSRASASVPPAGAEAVSAGVAEAVAGGLAEALTLAGEEGDPDSDSEGVTDDAGSLGVALGSSPPQATSPPASRPATPAPRTRRRRPASRAGRSRTDGRDTVGEPGEGMSRA
ncbi:hypothetical protein GCM10028771_06730 [Nocardioides marmoraquaticus]